MFTLSTPALLYFVPTIVAAHRGHHVTGILLTVCYPFRSRPVLFRAHNRGRAPRSPRHGNPVAQPLLRLDGHRVGSRCLLIGAILSTPRYIVVAPCPNYTYTACRR